jgi:hypothetical protein
MLGTNKAHKARGEQGGDGRSTRSEPGDGSIVHGKGQKFCQRRDGFVWMLFIMRQALCAGFPTEGKF